MNKNLKVAVRTSKEQVEAILGLRFWPVQVCSVKVEASGSLHWKDLHHCGDSDKLRHTRLTDSSRLTQIEEVEPVFR